jgi:hypothetical protein
MPRLIAYGCSHTFGQYLPSKDLAWPRVFGEDLKDTYRYYNFARPGCSNKYIWFNVLSRMDYRPSDLVVIMWTYEHRASIIDNDNPNHPDHNITSLGAHINTKQSKLYYKHIHNENDHGWDFWLRLDHISKTLPCTVIHTTCTKGPTIPKPNWVNADLHCPGLWEKMMEEYPKAEDGEHAGEEAHRWFGKQFANYCKRKIIEQE